MKNIIRKIARKLYYLLPISQSKREELYQKRKEKNEYKGISLDDMYNTLCKYDIISFDIFDTLITRNMYEPNDIFKLMEEKLNIESFAEKRQLAENEARKILKKDVNLSEIYESYKNINKISSSEVNKIQKLEEALELKFIIPRLDMLDLIKKLFKKNKTMIIVSDMYLDKTFILKMLKKCGYDKKYFKEIYISNEVNMRKDTKEIWDYISKKYKKYRMIHVGDNDKSDVNYPKEYKIHTFKIMSSKELFYKSRIYNNLKQYTEKRNVSDSIFLGTIVNKKLFNSPFSNLKINTVEDLGYSFNGPILNEFLKFIVEKSEDVDDLLFLAREGYYLQKLYNDYIKTYHLNAKNNIYFLASRKATYTSTLYDENDINKLIDKEFTGSFRKFMNQLFDIDVDEEMKITLPSDLDIASQKLKPYIKEILKNSKEEKKAYIKYIKQTIKQFDKKKLGIVDLGYSGTIQYNLTKMLNKEFIGLYLTNSSNVKKYSEQSELQFCFDINKNENYKNIFYYSLILEFLLSAPYGQLQRFEINDKVAKPVYNNEILDKDKKKVLQLIYKQVVSYIKDIHDFSDVYNITPSKDLLVCLYTSIVDSGIINQNVKDYFDFMDSFDASEIRNVFKIISKY